MPESDLGNAQSEPVLKSLDAWWTVLVIDPLAVRFVRVTQRFAIVTPTVLTVVAHLLGVVTAMCFASGWLLVGGVLFEVRFVIDCADGKLARVRGTSSATGAYLDYVGDYFVVTANLMAIALYLVWEESISLVLAVGLPAAFLAHVAAGQARDLEVVASGQSDRPPRGRLPDRYTEWMARRRLRTTPSRIEAEHLLLFVAPLVAWSVDDAGLLVAVASLVTLYFIYRTVRIAIGGYRVAAERDATRSSPT